MQQPNKLLKKMRKHFWMMHAPLVVLSAAIGFGVWFVLVGNTWPAWAAAMVPILGAATYIYPWPPKAR